MQSEHIKTSQAGALEGAEKPILGPPNSPKKQKVEKKVAPKPTAEKDAGDDAMKVPVAVKLSCDA
eukprot:13035424-Ditylum_brightwellii.AAC.1